MNSTIGEEEKLFRNVIRDPNFWKTETGRPSSAIFKDSKGVSVDRDGDRDTETIVSTFKQRFTEENIKAVVYVNASYCYYLKTHIVYKPVTGNIYHAEIHNSQDKIVLSPSIAKKLVNECKIVYLN